MTQFSRSSTGIEVVNAFPGSVAGKTIVITGTSENSVGSETAISFAHGNPKNIILAGRSENKSLSVIKTINNLNSAIKVTYIHLDLASQASVRRAAADIHAVTDKIDILVNNAAIMACPYEKTEDGIESQFGTNYLSHFLFTNLLMDRIQAAGKGARIVNLTSNAAKDGKIFLDDVNFEDGKTYHPIAGYSQSKAAIVLFSSILAKKFDSQNIASFSVHPGSIVTGLQKHFQDPVAFQSILDYVKAQTNEEVKLEETKTFQEGCSTTLVAALDPSITAFSGSYLADGNIPKDQPCEEAISAGVAEKLWALSEKLVGQEFSY